MKKSTLRLVNRNWKNNRRFIRSFLVLCLALGLMGCSADPKVKTRAGTQNKVEEVMQQQMGANGSSGSSDASTAADTESIGDGTSEGEDIPASSFETSIAATSATSQAVEAATGTDGIDYDLTQMSADMVFATVNQVMHDPAPYEGKVFRMEGQYYVYADSKTGNNYFYCVIKDAFGCCKQGLEFVWGDGSHVYPDEYPEEYSEITVTGTFERYKEDDTSYVRIKDATMEVVSGPED